MEAQEAGSEVDFAEAARIKPEFVGLLVDWSIGAREVTGAITDLVLRDAFFISGNRLCLNRAKAGALAGFERNFSRLLFGDADSLTSDEVRARAYGSQYNELVRAICDGMFEEGMIRPDAAKAMAGEVRKAVSQVTGVPVPTMSARASLKRNAPINIEMGERDESGHLKPIIPPESVSRVLNLLFLLGAKAAPLLVVLFLLDIAAVIAMGLTGFAKGGTGIWLFGLAMFMLLPLALGMIAAGLLGSIYNISAGIQRKVSENTGADFGDIILSEKGKRSKQVALALYAYMRTYPLLEDRLANELAAHAMALGLGTVWLRRLGGRNAEVAKMVEALGGGSTAAMKFVDMNAYVKEYFYG